MLRNNAFQRGLTSLVFAAAILGPVVADDLSPNLEHLLRELEVAEQVAPARGVGDDAEFQNALARIVKDRNDVVRQNGGFFEMLLKTRQEYETYGRATALLAQANQFFAIAQANVAQQISLSATTGREALGLANAQASLSRATANLRDADAKWKSTRESLSDHIGRVQKQGGEFFRTYNSLRNLLPHRRNAANELIADALAEQRRHAPDFIEGDIVEAVARAYSGQVEEATARLEEAAKGFGRCPPLLDTMLAEDCCAAWLLLGRLDKVGGFIGAIDRVNVGQRTAAQQWLTAAYSAMRGRAAEAVKKYNVAIAKANNRVPQALRAEAALAAIGALKGPQAVEKAKDYLKGVVGDSEWTVLRARAALAAADGEWEKAAGLVEQAIILAPACMEHVLERERVGYEKGEPWSAKLAR